MVVELGTSAEFRTSGYVGAVGVTLASSAVTVASSTSGFQIVAASMQAIRNGILTLTLANASNNTWIASGITADMNGPAVAITSGYVSLPDVLGSIRVTTAGGTNIFDGGGINISWEI